MPTCPKCGHSIFQMTEFTPIGSAFKLMAVHCASCGAVVGVMDYMNIGATQEKHEEALKKIARQLGVSLGRGWD